jgi:tetratricopeptide (TPR) repeat protein
MLRTSFPRRPVPPSVVNSLYATGYSLFAEQRLSHARSVFRGMVHLAPEDERGWLALGACYEANHAPDLALRLYEAAGRVARGAPRCEVARARILRARGQVDEAGHALVEASRLAHVSADAELRELVTREWAEQRRAAARGGHPPESLRPGVSTGHRTVR